MAQQHNGRVTRRKVDVDFAFDPGSLEIGDLIDLEEAFGVTIDHLMSLVNSSGSIQGLSGKTIAALTFIVKRQMDPEFTPEMARKIKIDELVSLMKGKPGAAPKAKLAGTGRPPATDPTPGD